MSPPASSTSPRSSGADSSDRREPMRAVLLEGVHPAAAQALRAAGLEVESIAQALEGDALRDAIAGASLVGIRSRTRLEASVLDAAPSLAAIGCFCIGTNQVELGAAANRGVPVFNSPFGNTRSVAELTLAEIVMLLRGIVDRSSDLHRGVWKKSASGSHEVRGRVLGIVGYGHIGSQLSVLAESLGMQVVFFDIDHKLPLGNACAVGSLDELLERSDVVSLHVPETPQTRGMIGGAEIDRMKRGAILVNNARGSLVDLDAAAEALRRGHLGGIAADVFPQEPESNGPGFACPLVGVAGAILTPHIGGSTEEAQESIGRDVAEKLLRFVLGGSTRGAVNVPEVDLPRRVEGRHRILHFHRNVPGVLGRMHTMLAARGINIHAEYLQSDVEISYVILDVDASDADTVQADLATIPETLRMRMIC
ncbi:MAG: phosphoglycerate dehydrogenase [Phycisphaerales bacterium]